jgi:hypothetical protein
MPVRVLGAETRNVDFVETCFKCRTDFVFVRYSVANNGLPSNNRFLFRGNAVEVIWVWKRVCNIFAPVFIYSYLSHIIHLWQRDWLMYFQRAIPTFQKEAQFGHFCYIVSNGIGWYWIINWKLCQRKSSPLISDTVPEFGWGTEENLKKTSVRSPFLGCDTMQRFGWIFCLHLQGQNE